MNRYTRTFSNDQSEIRLPGGGHVFLMGKYSPTHFYFRFDNSMFWFSYLQDLITPRGWGNHFRPNPDCQQLFPPYCPEKGPRVRNRRRSENRLAHRQAAKIDPEVLFAGLYGSHVFINTENTVGQILGWVFNSVFKCQAYLPGSQSTEYSTSNNKDMK